MVPISPRIQSLITVLCIMVIVATYWAVLRYNGLTIQIDSVSYIRGAINLHAGQGFTHGGKLINHFPIGFSLWLHGLMYILPSDVFHVAYWNALLCLTGLGWMFYKISELCRIAQPVRWIGLFLFLFSLPVWFPGSMLLTELPTLFIISIGTYWLLVYLLKTQQKRYLIGIGFLLGITCLIRFAAIGIAGGFMGVVIWHHRRQLRAALNRILWIGIPCLIPMISYSAYTKYVYKASATNRMVMWHPISLGNISLFFRTPLQWLIDLSTAPMPLIISLLVLALLGILVWRKKLYTFQFSSFIRQSITSPKHFTLWIMSGVYMVFITCSISLFDYSTPVNTRILSPISIYFYLGLLMLFNKGYHQARSKKIGLAMIAGFTMIFSWQTFQSMLYYNWHTTGFNKPYWRNTGKDVVCDSSGRWVNKNQTIYTNGYLFWYLYNDRPLKRIPEKGSMVNRTVNPKYRVQLDSMRTEIRSGQAQLVYFEDIAQFRHKNYASDILPLFSDTTQFNIIRFEKGFSIRKRIP